jgi:predicted GIY-YIG superfamily endonuclease
MAASDCKRTLYLLLDPRTDEVRYVGITKHDINRRFASHIQDSYNKRHQSHRVRWLRSLREQGLKPAIRKYRDVEEGERWQDAEIAAVAHFKKLGARLVNGTVGGDGTTGREWRPNAEQRAKMADFRTGMRPTDEDRRKRSASLKKFYEDPVQMAKRKALGSAAGKSAGSRSAASARMKAIWADPVRAAEMRTRMRGLKKKEMCQEARDARSIIAKRLFDEGRILLNRQK